MTDFSRRQLARYAADELLAKRQPKDLADRLAAALTVTGRAKEAQLLMSDIDQELEDRGLLAKVKVTSAGPLSASLRRELLLGIKKATGVKEVILEHQMDKDIIGGLKVETAKHSWDKTLRRALTDIKEVI